MKKRFLWFAVVIVTLSIFVSCCSRPQGLVEGSSVFRLNYHEGFIGTHSRSYLSLQVKDNRQWKDVWNAIRGADRAWGDKIIFSAVTSDEDAQNQRYRLLFYQQGKWIADIDDLLRVERVEMMKRHNLTDSDPIKSWQYPSDGIVMRFDTTPPVEIKIPISRIAEIAEQVRAKNKKVVYCGNEYYK